MNDAYYSVIHIITTAGKVDWSFKTIIILPRDYIWETYPFRLNIFPINYKCVWSFLRDTIVLAQSQCTGKHCLNTAAKTTTTTAAAESNVNGWAGRAMRKGWQRRWRRLVATMVNFDAFETFSPAAGICANGCAAISSRRYHYRAHWDSHTEKNVMLDDDVTQMEE